MKIKKLGCLLLALLPLHSFADGEDGMSDECLRSVRDLYKFYYYEIQPNPKNSTHSPDEKLNSTEALHMQVVIGELRKHCSQNIIAKINESLKNDSQQRTENS